MKRVFLIALLSIASFVAGATQQINDKVIFEGETWEITSFPIEYLQPEMKDAFTALLGERDFISTANYRGYIAYWYIKRGRLYLDRVEVPQSNGESKILSGKELKKVFRKYRSFGKIKAGWITGNIEVGYGIGQPDAANPHLPAFAKKETWVLKKGKIVLRTTK